METKQGSKKQKMMKSLLGISAATIVAAGATVGICYAIWHKQKNPETSFNVSCTNTTGPNLVFNTANTLSLTWTSANYTPTNFTLKDGDSNNNWTLINNGNHQLTLARQSSLPANVYNVVIQASDDITTNEDTEVVTISNPVEKDLFFTTGDTITTPNSTKAFYGTISAANFTLCDDANLKVQVNGAFPTGDDTWTAITFDNKSHIKITPPSSLTAGDKFQISIYDLQNDITSNAIGFSVQAKMTVDDNKYMKITNASVPTIADVATTIWLNSQNLVGLYFGQNSTVTTLNCYSNQLTQLDVSGNSALTNLYCQANQLQQLDVSKNTNLQSLDCYSNQLQQLDVSNNSQLQYLPCFSNQLQQLDVSNNSQLTELNCSSNQLTSLDVSSNTNLQLLSCYVNQLQQLDVSNNTQLATLTCSSNPLNLIKLPTNKTSGTFTFATAATTAQWTASGYATTGDIYCNASLTVNSLPSTWTRHNY